MMRIRVAAMLLVLLALGRPAAAGAQQPTLPHFVAQVATLWAAEDVDAIVALAAPGDDIILDVGQGPAGTVSARQAAMALRALFSSRETTGVRAARATFSGGSPASGFGELRWEARTRGVTELRRATVFVAVVWDGRAWRIRQIRVLG